MSVTTDFRIQVEVKSDTGLERKENQDQLNRFVSPFGEVLMVADGMGGYQGGATAARMVVQGYQACLSGLPGTLPYEEALREATRRTAAEVYKLGKSGDPNYAQMGSTVVLALLRGRDLVVAHIGDSRAYLFRDGRLTRLTRDHTRLQPFIDAGKMTEAEAREHPDASVLSRVIGHTPEVDLEVSKPLVLQAGDGILLCSDGLSGYVDDPQLEQALRRYYMSPQQAVETLLQMALATGGHDNITIEYAYVQRDATVLLPVESPANHQKKVGMPRWLLPALLALAVLLAGAWWWKKRQQQAQKGDQTFVVPVSPSPEQPAAPAPATIPSAAVPDATRQQSSAQPPARNTPPTKEPAVRPAAPATTTTPQPAQELVPPPVPAGDPGIPQGNAPGNPVQPPKPPEPVKAAPVTAAPKSTVAQRKESYTVVVVYQGGRLLGKGAKALAEEKHKQLKASSIGSRMKVNVVEAKKSEELTDQIDVAYRDAADEEMAREVQKALGAPRIIPFSESQKKNYPGDLLVLIPKSAGNKN